MLNPDEQRERQFRADLKTAIALSLQASRLEPIKNEQRIRSIAKLTQPTALQTPSEKNLPVHAQEPTQSHRPTPDHQPSLPDRNQFAAPGTRDLISFNEPAQPEALYSPVNTNPFTLDFNYLNFLYKQSAPQTRPGQLAIGWNNTGTQGVSNNPSTSGSSFNMGFKRNIDERIIHNHTQAKWHPQQSPTHFRTELKQENNSAMDMNLSSFEGRNQSESSPGAHHFELWAEFEKSTGSNTLTPVPLKPAPTQRESLSQYSVAPEKERNAVREKITHFMPRAEAVNEKVKEQIELLTYHEEIAIDDNETGKSYESLFGRFLKDPAKPVREVKIEDPYIRHYHQFNNFLRFCELIVKTCPSLSKVTLVTVLTDAKQREFFRTMVDILRDRVISLDIEHSPTLHDRQVTLSNGWVIKLGRGLDYFKAPSNNVSLGFFDLDLRPCHQTKIDVYFTKS